MVQQIRNIEAALGDGIKKPNKSEAENAKVVQKSILAKHPIKKGETLTEENLTVKRAGAGIPASLWDAVVGCRAIKDYDIDEPIKLY
jgi:sialic acid synthase SpsE